MDWKAKDDDRQALTGIAEMLVALAFLADLACNRSHAVRHLILWILAPAEAFARDFVILEAQAAGGAIPDLPVSLPVGDSVADAMRLAACFRALAMALKQLPIQPTRFARRLTPRYTPIRHAARILQDMSSGPAFTPTRPFDTS